MTRSCSEPCRLHREQALLPQACSHSGACWIRVSWYLSGVPVPMKHNVILVVLDGLNYEVARHAMGHLQAYVGAGRAALYTLECELPALSRPLYECILTGVVPIDSGIVHNNVSRLSNQRTIGRAHV